MKLYIWEGDGVLSDYTNGLIIAMGEDLEDALKAIESECSFAMGAFPAHKPTTVIDLDGVIVGQAWLCWGGG